mgnify:CR=1 FL=1
MSSLIQILKDGKFSKYVQIKSNQDLIKEFLSKEENKGKPADIEFISQVASDLFTSLTKDGKTIKEILDFLDKTYSNDENASEIFDEISNNIKIIYEKDFKDKLNSKGKSIAKKLITDDSIKIITGGIIKTNKKDKKTDNQLINQDINVSLEKPGLVAILHNKRNYRAGTRNSLELQIFINLLSNVEMSKLYPYFDCSFFMPGSFLKNSNDSEIAFNKLSAGSIHNYLFGTLKNDFLNIYNSFDNLDKSKKGQNTNMSLFTTPQTLNNFNEKYGLFENVLKVDPTAGQRRLTSPHDIARPFLTLKNFSVDVAPTKGLMSFKTARMSLVLHDRTRLSEVTPFIKPDLFGPIGSDISVEYGWSHINGKDKDDYIARFLHNSRVKEKYMIVNSSFNIDGAGQVNIDLSLAMKAPIMFQHIKISGAPAVSSELDTLTSIHRSIMNEIANFNRNVDSKKAKIKYKVNKQLQSLMSHTKISSISEKQSKKIEELKIIQDNKLTFKDLGIEEVPNKNKINDPELKKKISTVEKNLNKLTKTFVEHLKNLEKAIAKRETTNQNIIDEFNFKTIEDEGSFYSNEWDENYSQILRSGQNKNNGGIGHLKLELNKKFITFGTFLTNLINQNFINHKFYDEVQLVFYTLNSGCGLGANQNISGLLLDKKNLKDYLLKFFNNNISISIEGFITNIIKEFIQTEKQVFYGIDEFYDKPKKTKTNNNNNKKKKKQPKKDKAKANKQYSKLVNRVNDRLEYIRNLTGNNKNSKTFLNDIDFLMPSIHLSFDTFSNEENKSICRISIYDRNDNPFGSLNRIYDNSIDNNGFFDGSRQVRILLEEIKRNNKDTKSLKDQVVELIKRDFVTLDEDGNINVNSGKNNEFTKEIKEELKNHMPNLVFGQENSPMIEATVSSINDAKLDTVFMTRSTGNSKAEGVKFNNSLPLSVKPTQASVTMIGCPFINFAQNVFLEFNTGTTIDNRYNVTGLKHEISPGKFNTQATLSYGEAFGKYETAVNNIAAGVQAVLPSVVAGDSDLLKKLKDISDGNSEKDKENIPTSGALKIQDKESNFKISTNKNSELLKYLGSTLGFNLDINLKTNILLDNKNKLNIFNTSSKNPKGNDIQENSKIFIETNIHCLKSEILKNSNKISFSENNILNHNKVLNTFNFLSKTILDKLNEKSFGILINDLILDKKGNFHDVYIPIVGNQGFFNLSELVTPTLNTTIKLNESNRIQISDTITNQFSLTGDDKIKAILSASADSIDITNDIIKNNIEDVKGYPSDLTLTATTSIKFEEIKIVISKVDDIKYSIRKFKSELGLNIIGLNHDLKNTITSRIEKDNTIVFSANDLITFIMSIYEIKKLD